MVYTCPLLFFFPTPTQEDHHAPAPTVKLLRKSALRFRHHEDIGPLRVNFSRSGMSRTWRFGPFSRNSRQGCWRINLPGPFYWYRGLKWKTSWKIGTKHFYWRINASNSGLSRTLKIGPWSRNSRTRSSRIDLPGSDLYLQGARRPKKRGVHYRGRFRGENDQDYRDRRGRSFAIRFGQCALLALALAYLMTYLLV